MSKEQVCPKCKGRVHIDRDEYGWFIECITCGYMLDLTKMVVTEKDNSAHESISTKAD